MSAGKCRGGSWAGLCWLALLVAVLLNVPRATAQESSGARPSEPGRDASLAEAGARQVVAAGWKASWSPDGKQLVFAKPEGRGLQILNIAEGTVRSLTDSGKDPLWSPDGRWIAFVKEPGFNDYVGEETWIIKPDGSSAHRVVGGGFPSWSGDGKRLIVHVRREPKLVDVAVDDPDAEPELFCDRIPSWYPAVSPDGKRIAFGQAGMLVVIQRSDGEVLLRWPAPGSRGLLPSWSPDGKQVAFGGFDDDPFGLWVLNIDSQRAIRVAAGTYTMAAWSPDGQWLAFDYRGPTEREVWTIETQKLEGRKSMTLAEAQAAAPSAARATAAADEATLPEQDGFAIGSEAPEIQGEGIDGVPFKLSDYRGHVVVVDFWGDW